MTAPPAPNPGPQTLRVPLDKLVPIDGARPLDEENVQRIQHSIAELGLQQFPGAIADGDHFLLIFGAHRVESLRRLGHHDVECRVWPQGTTPQEALLRSLHENHVRRSESLSETMRRVTTLMKHHRCQTLAEGGRLAGLSAATISKLHYAIKHLAPQNLALVHQHRLGISVAYGVAKAAPDSDTEQTELLEAHVNGKMTRDEITKRGQEAAKPRAKRRANAPKVAKPKPLKLKGTINGIGVRLTIPLSAEHEAVRQALVTLAQRLDDHRQQHQPLPEFSFT
jgi:ParB-like chromosome segregation protein Spo0J